MHGFDVALLGWRNSIKRGISNERERSADLYKLDDAICMTSPEMFVVGGSSIIGEEEVKKGDYYFMKYYFVYEHGIWRD